MLIKGNRKHFKKLEKVQNWQKYKYWEIFIIKKFYD